MTLFTSTLATPVGVAAASTVVEAENVGKTLPASASSRTTTRVTTQTSSSADGFDCEGDLGGLLYQVIWSEKPPAVSSKKVFALKKYDPVTTKYTVVAEYKYSDITDSGQQSNPNGLSLDPKGRAYVTYSYDKKNKNVNLIQLLPGGGHTVIAELRKNVDGGDLNAGTYLEEDGVPYVIVSTGFAGGTSKKVNLDTEAVEDWISNAVEGEDFSTAIDDYLSRTTRRLLEPTRTFEEVLPLGLVGAVEKGIAAYLPMAIRRLGSTLEDEDAREKFKNFIHEILQPDT
jgi:hypothetical protein